MNNKNYKEQIINQAFNFHSKGNISEAAKYYEYFINQGFNDCRVFSNYGKILQDLGKLKKAELYQRKAIELNPSYENAYCNLGNVLIDLGKLKEAELYTRKAIAINPDLEVAHSNLGIILKSLGKLKEAELSYRKAIELNPNYAEAYSNLGNLLKDLGKLKEAELSYQKAIQIKPNYALAYSNLGNLLKKLGKLKEAELSYRKAIELNPNYALAYSNLGNLLKDLGKLKQAELSYRKAIELNPNYSEPHFNLGNLLKKLGKLKEAELSYRKAIELNPNYAEAYSNLGNLLKNLGKLKEAELCQRKAIEINHDLEEAHSNLGIILKDLGKLKEAELCQRKAIELNPNFANAYFSLAMILVDLDELEEGFDSYLKVIDINPTLNNIYYSITRFLKDSDPSKLNKSKLKYIINLLLSKNDISHNELVRAFNFVYGNEIISNLEEIYSDFSKIELFIKDQLIINALKKITFCDFRIEKILTKLRSKFCYYIAENIETINYSELQFIIALGKQCFLNEYIYSFTQEEKISIDSIIKRCRNGEINEIRISILSCYFPLYKVLDQIPFLKSFNSYNQSFKELIELQINEPIKEIELSQNIKIVGSINDKVSQKVKSQYEENPYPRWRYGNHSVSQKISILEVINNEINPNYISKTIGEVRLQVLIAGCGTGQHILSTQRYKNAQVTCIDLSLSSLAYAQRKINELRINNVELIQMDILEVALLKIKFDIIECSGVLHHMHNPTQGLKALVGVLKNNGFLKLGLYSELARKDIIEARHYIANKKLQANEENIRKFRETVLFGEKARFNSLKNSLDFYSLSSCRDLCFHSQEYRFTINQIREDLKSHKLEFLGFLLPKAVKSLYKQYFPEDKKQTNLQNWEKFEEKYYNTFKAMYQFWVSKTID